MPAPPSSVVSYDNSAISAYENTVASGSPFTWTQPTTAGAYAVVAVFGSSNANEITTAATYAVTYGGVSMGTALGSVEVGNTTGEGNIWVWGLANVPGGTPTISVTFTQSGDSFQGYGTSCTYLSVSSVGALQTAYGSSVAPSVAVTSAVGNRVWGAVSNAAGNTFSAFSLANTRQLINTSSNYPTFLAGDTPGAPTVTVSATVNVSYYWGAVGLNLT